MHRLKVGDLVQVTTGRDKGKRGRISRILQGEARVVVEGLNKITRHKKPDHRDPQGGRISKEASIHASNVMPIDAASDKPTRVRIAVGEDGAKTRLATSGAQLQRG
ncbi:MAG: 50S ribosomal protein L24 [Deltaproteobacteria bacterium]|nr:50S ribosomal protein L24 [Deltaproteobacteria bacterium]